MKTENPRTGGSHSETGLELTPAASEALDLKTDYFKQQVLEEASRSRGRSSDSIRIADVLSAIDRIAGTGRRYRSLEALTTITGLVAGALLVGQVFILYRQVSQPGWVLLTVSLLAGASIGIAAVIVFARRQIRDFSGKTLASESFLQQYSTLEATARRAASEVLGEQAESAALARIISSLELLRIWTPADSRVFRRLLILRNRLVHEYSRSLSPEDMNFALSETDRLTDLIRHATSIPSRPGLRKALGNRLPGLAFEEEVANVLRNAGFTVVSAPPDRPYDLLVVTPDGSIAIIVKYHYTGVFSVADVKSILLKLHSLGVKAIIVLNTALSKSALEYIRSEAPSGQPPVEVVIWNENEPDEALVESIRQAAGNPSP